MTFWLYFFLYMSMFIARLKWEQVSLNLLFLCSPPPFPPQFSVVSFHSSQTEILGLIWCISLHSEIKIKTQDELSSLSSSDRTDFTRQQKYFFLPLRKSNYIFIASTIFWWLECNISGARDFLLKCDVQPREFNWKWRLLYYKL